MSSHPDRPVRGLDDATATLVEYECLKSSSRLRLASHSLRPVFAKADFHLAQDFACGCPSLLDASVKEAQQACQSRRDSAVGDKEGDVGDQNGVQPHQAGVHKESSKPRQLIVKLRVPPESSWPTTRTEQQEQFEIKNSPSPDETIANNCVFNGTSHGISGTRNMQRVDQTDRALDELEEDESIDTMHVAGSMPGVSPSVNEQDQHALSDGAGESSLQVSTGSTDRVAAASPVQSDIGAAVSQSSITVNHGPGPSSEASTPVTRRRRRRHDDLSIDGTANLDLHRTAAAPVIKKLYLSRGRWWEYHGPERPDWAEDEKVVEQETATSTSARATKRARRE